MKLFSNLVTLATVGVAATAMAAQPTFTNTRVIDYTPHCCLGNPMAMTVAPNGSSLYFGDWYGDDVYYVATPLTSNGTDNDLTNTMQAGIALGAWSSGGWSYQGADLDGNNVIVGGANAADTQLFSLSQTSPGVFSSNQITGISGIYSGPSVVGTNKVVMANYATGGLQFFNIASFVATPDGSEIANPNVTTQKTLSVNYDATSGKIFTYIVDDNLTRRIDIFNSNGTAAGTTYIGTWTAGAVGTLTAAGSANTSHNRSAQITINEKYRILICPFRDGTSDGFDIFDISTVGATGTPYLTLRSADMGEPLYPGTGRDVTGSAIFASGANDYLALNFWNRMSILQVTSAAVSEWSLY